jgi:hypothetical protein
MGYITQPLPLHLPTLDELNLVADPTVFAHLLEVDQLDPQPDSLGHLKAGLLLGHLDGFREQDAHTRKRDVHGLSIDLMVRPTHSTRQRELTPRIPPFEYQRFSHDSDP